MGHAYSTDSAERRYIPFFIAAIAIALALCLSEMLGHFRITIPWWAPSVDTMALYGLLYSVFDNVVWKWPLTHRLKITRVPDLTGTWQGYVDPHKDDSDGSTPVRAKTDIVITIRQSWTRIAITGRTAASRSRSLSASMIVGEECSVSYEYVNEPSAAAVESMHTHRGTCILNLVPGEERLEGEYYSGRDRQGIGIIVLTRAPSAEN